jgi:hypothetical protein
MKVAHGIGMLLSPCYGRMEHHAHWGISATCPEHPAITPYMKPLLFNLSIDCVRCIDQHARATYCYKHQDSQQASSCKMFRGCATECRRISEALKKFMACCIQPCRRMQQLQATKQDAKIQTRQIDSKILFITWFSNLVPGIPQMLLLPGRPIS